MTFFLQYFERIAKFLLFFSRSTNRNISVLLYKNFEVDQ